MAPSAWPRSRSNWSCCRSSAGRLASDLFAAEIDIAGSAVSEGDIARVLGRRQPAFDARRPRRAAFAADRLFDRRRQRHPRSARHARFAVRRRHACGDDRRGGGAQSDAWRSSVAIFPSRRWSPAPMSPVCRCLPTTKPISAPRLSIWARARRRWRCSPAAASFIPEGFALGGHNVTLDIARG